MAHALRIINIITLAGAILLIVMSLWPGYASGCWMLLALPLIGALGLAWAIVSASCLPRPWGRGVPLRLRQILIAPVIVLLTYGMLRFYIPRRMAFVLLREGFARHVATAPVSEYHGQRLGWVGIYRVDEYAADPRGGVYFRTGWGFDGPDVITFGFVYRPNAHGSPFGAAKYLVRRLQGDWYWFRASDDWR